MWALCWVKLHANDMVSIWTHVDLIPQILQRKGSYNFYFIFKKWEKIYICCNLSFEVTIRVEAWQRDYVQRVSQYSNIFLQVNMKKWVSTFIIGFTFWKLESCDVSKVQIGSCEIIEKVLICTYLKWDHFFLIWSFKTQVMVF
jgi:hypothetical protein